MKPSADGAFAQRLVARENGSDEGVFADEHDNVEEKRAIMRDW